MEFRPILSTLLRQRTGPLLVALQVAISLAILANAIFIVQQRIAASQRPSGVADEKNVGYLFVMPLQRRSHVDNIAEQQRERDAIAAVPGVVAVSWASQMPMSRSGNSGSVRLKPGQEKETTHAAFYYSQPGFVSTMGLKLVEGRDMNDADVIEFDPATMGPGQGDPDGAIITRRLGKVLFPDASTYTGREIYHGGPEKKPTRIIGVVETLQTPGAGMELGEHSVILPLRISYPFSKYVIRAEPGRVDRVLEDAREAVRKAAPAPVRTSIRTVAEDRRERYRNERALAWMLIAIAVLLLLVTASGIVGMTALRVAQRRKQIGVRRALGARWRDILRYFIVENLIITTGGIVAGLLLAVGLNRFLMAQVEMARLPLEYLAFGAAGLWALGIAAVCGPASRAASISPAIATRTA
ncbi:MAG TPA: FtsX-like permease family protein [Usitatibacter sp.]|nr:FtsX-like permease family protein [Usitatibacter sp.]